MARAWRERGESLASERVAIPALLPFVRHDERGIEDDPGLENTVLGQPAPRSHVNKARAQAALHLSPRIYCSKSMSQQFVDRTVAASASSSQKENDFERSTTACRAWSTVA